MPAPSTWDPSEYVSFNQAVRKIRKFFGVSELEAKDMILRGGTAGNAFPAADFELSGRIPQKFWSLTTYNTWQGSQ